MWCPYYQARISARMMKILSKKQNIEHSNHTELYSMSFIAGALLLSDSVQLATLFLELGDWNLVRDVVIDKNLLQMKKIKSSLRLYQEICSRLKTLTVEELELLVHGSVQDQSHLLWLAICRRYKFIADFAVEVLREKFLTLIGELNNEDFDIFFHQKSEMHEELDAIKPVTRVKARQVLFRMLRDANLLSSDRRIKGTILSSAFLNVILPEQRHDLLFFPIWKSNLGE